MDAVEGNEEVDVDGHLRMLAKERARDDRDRERKRNGVRKLEGHRIDGDAHGVPRADAGGNGGRTAGPKVRRSSRLRGLQTGRTARVQAFTTSKQGKPPITELEHLLDMTHLLCCMPGRSSKAGACGGGAGAEGDYHPGCYPSLVAGSYPRDRLESHRVEDRPP